MNNPQIIIDIGARDTIYPIKCPQAICHLFEPHPEHFKKLQEKFATNKNVYLNNYGLGEKNEMLRFNPILETFEGSEAMKNGGDYLIEIKTLDWYIEQNKITYIDLLKVDAEGMDYKILLGGPKAIALAKYMQVEYWEDQLPFRTLLEATFDMKDIGERNILCKRKKQNSAL